MKLFFGLNLSEIKLNDKAVPLMCGGGHLRVAIDQLHKDFSNNTKEKRTASVLNKTHHCSLAINAYNSV